MALRSIALLAVGAFAGASTYAVVSSGALVGVASDLTRVPAAAAAELPAFGDCEQLRQWYVDATLPKVGPYGLEGGGHPVPLAMEGAAGRADASSSSVGSGAQDAVGSSGTGTNVQEASVDEADVAKTDGRLVVRVVDGELVVSDVTGDQPRELSRTRLPGPALVSPELLLHDDTVTVVGEEQLRDRRPRPMPIDPGIGDGREIWPGPVAGSGRTRVVTLDLSTPSAPVVTGERGIDGEVLSGRSHADGTVRVVTTSADPTIDFVAPHRGRTQREALRENRRIVREAPVTAWLPRLRGPEGEQPLDCTQVRHPRTSAGYGTITVLGLDPDRPDELDTTSVVASGDLVYSSAERLYVATTSQGGGWLGRPRLRTSVHAFALDETAATYLASGRVPGTVKDRWSFDEHRGHLRVATALGDPWQPDENAVVVLTERGGELVETGRVAGLGEDEQIKSVRWLDDLAVVVTFRQTDPLYTLDLADPRRPRLLGELKIPGFSTYLHPVGDDLLLGLGHDATPDGADLGVQAAGFDLRDLSDVRRTDTLDLGGQAALGVETDTRAFTYLPQHRTALTTVEDWSTGRTRLVAVAVSADGTLEQTRTWPVERRAGAPARTLPLDDGRVVLVDDGLRLVDLR